MKVRSDAFDGSCPECGHSFTLADLRRMALGDGFQRYLAVRLSTGARAVVSFDDYDPLTMQPWRATEEANEEEKVA